MSEDRIVARIGDRTVLYKEIACNREVAAQNPRWLRGRPLEEACAEADRDAFRTRAARILVEQICALESYTPSEADVDAVRSPILKDEAMLQGLASEGRKIPEAVHRVYRGETIESVYAEVIAPLGRSLEEFREHVELYRSLEVVERFLAQDFVAKARQHYEASALDRAMRAAIRKHLEAAAALANQSFEEAADAYLREMVERIGVTVEPGFELPAGREVFRRERR